MELKKIELLNLRTGAELKIILSNYIATNNLK